MARITISGPVTTYNNGTAVPWDDPLPYKADLALRTDRFASDIISLVGPAVASDRTVNPERLNANLIGVTPFGLPDGSYVKSYDEIAFKSKSSGSFKEFEKAKRDGKIIIKPMIAYELKASATPSISAAQIKNGPRITGTYEKYLPMGDSGTGVINKTWRQVPSLSIDTGSKSFFTSSEIFEDPYIATVPTSIINSLNRDVISHLSREVIKKDLVTKVVAEANSATFDIATEIGEMPETIKMILNGVMAGIKLLLRAKRDIKQNLSSGSVKTDAASIWMMYRYGLMPIVYSVNDGLDLLEMESKKFQSFRGRSDSPAEKFAAHGYECISAPDVQHRCFLKYGYDLESTIHQGLKINLAATAWELIPLSFVFDWFFQVGDYLTAFFRPGAVDQIGCSYSTRVKGKYVFQNDKYSVITIDVDYYKVDEINPDSFIGINSDIFVSFKRSMDALALSWLLFKKKK